MELLTVSEARKNLYKLVDNLSNTHVPTFIKGKRNSAVLLSKEDWDNLQETLYLLSVPGMRELIIEADKELIENCSKNLDW
jgi:antitoxin YefM